MSEYIIIDTKDLGTIDGFDIKALLVPDTDAEYDYDETEGEVHAAVRAAWLRDEWSYVGTVIVASKADVELGTASLWGSEYGSIPGVEGFVSPLQGEGEEFVNGYGPGLIAEAIAEAQAKLAELNAPVSA